MKKIVYLDNASTTFPYKRVIRKMNICFKKFGNYSSFNFLGVKTKDFIDEKVYKLSKLIGCSMGNIIFTSCATEANNIVIYSVVRKFKKCIVLCFSTEHLSVINCLKFFRKKIKVFFINPNIDGSINKSCFLRKVIELKPNIVFCMYVNNETGIINDVMYICKICRKYNIFLHIDCSQIVGKIYFKLSNLKATSYTFSAHKNHGPKGIGFLYYENKFEETISPLIIGGGQQNNLRSGTMPIQQIVGLYESYKISIKNQKKNFERITYLRNKILKNINKENIEYNLIKGNKIPNILNISFKNFSNEMLILKLENFIISKGSACSSYKESHVLKSMGFSKEYVNSSVRISIGNKNSIYEINKFNEKISSIFKIALS
ncbi:Cysteine desulfurase [Candidatus Vidania fulgoroideae]|nr:Cysteine desulfurase [Candidatus Vidania fulgoroideae]